MIKQGYNPYLPSTEYVPDGEPYVFGDRVYVYGSHDQFNGKKYCMNDYVCWSAPVDDLKEWNYEGVIYKKNQDPMNQDGKKCLYAPDIQKGPDGRFYLYYAFDFLGVMGVAVAPSPTGPFEFYGHVAFSDGHIVGKGKNDIFQFDPGVLVDDDGRIYLYSGFAPEDSLLFKAVLKGRKYEGCYLMELEQDMKTVKSGPTLLLPKKGHAQGTGFENHEFFEASSIRKVNGKYYFIYSSANGHELCYAISDKPDGDFTYGGTIVSNGDIFLDGRTEKDALNYIGNNHGSIECINGQWYVFYHRQTNKHDFSRQGCAEPILIEGDGSIPQVEITSCGLNGGPLEGNGIYEARIACNLWSENGTVRYNGAKQKLKGHPYFTQEGIEQATDCRQYVANMCKGSVAGFKYFKMNGLREIAILVRGDAEGKMNVLTAPETDAVAEIKIRPAQTDTWFRAPAQIEDGVTALYFQYEGTGSLDFLEFELICE